LASDDVYSLLRDRKGRMWVGTFGGGLDLALPDGKGGYIFRHFFNDSYGQKRIRMLVEDRNGWIGAATSDGVFIFRPERLLADEQAYYHYNRQNGNLRSNEIRHLLQDRNGNLWIAEAGAGFSICKPGDDYARLRFSHYGVSDGLVNDMIQAFAEDSKGNIWITTEYGVSCFDVSSKTFLNYFLSMQMLQNVYNETSALALPDGRILMGSNDGVTVVDPSRVNTDRRIPSVTFTDLRLNGVSAGNSGTERLFEKSLPYTSSVQLDYSQHSFTVYFSTLDYSAIVPPRFTYQLQGYDKGWSVPSVLPWGTYKNLPPGTYKLHVKACNSFGQWGDDYTTLEIVIVPPFWRTGWAFVIYLFLLGSLMYVAWRVVRRMDDLRNKVKVEKELTEYKLRFFTHISHEFRTPLTLIQVALDKMHQVKVIPKEMVSSVRMMDKSARRMSRLVNQLLEFRKMQEKKPVLSLEEADVIAFLHEIYLNFKEVAESKRMDFRFLPSVPSYKMFLDKEKLDKIVYNLLSNAFKYTPSGGKVDFSVQVDETIHQLVIRVVDTGVGIPKEKREQLFKHYLQNSLSGDSMGIGLYLVHELVQVHKGTVVYEECRGGGSVFIVTLPADVSVYDKKDFLIPESALLHEEELRHCLSPVMPLCTTAIIRASFFMNVVMNLSAVSI